jgi:hypothetical protein
MRLLQKFLAIERIAGALHGTKKGGLQKCLYKPLEFVWLFKGRGGAKSLDKVGNKVTFRQGEAHTGVLI